MEFHEIIIIPRSSFETPLKGDTIFGHFCWQAANDTSLLENGLEKQITVYPENPFAVFSSAFPRHSDANTPYFFKRPEAPLDCFVELKDLGRKQKIEAAKNLKKKSWFCAGKDLLLNVHRDNLYSDEELADTVKLKDSDYDIKKSLSAVKRHHNTIHRLTGTTGTGMFSPFEIETVYYCPGTVLTVFVLINPGATDIERVVAGMTRIGKWGFGKDAGTGMGRFDVQETRPLKTPDFSGAKALYTLAPCVPEKNKFREQYITPFVRFGKHGDKLAMAENPFKNPVIMADEGAILIPEGKNGYDRPYAGCAVGNVSLAMPATVVQGYAPVLPINLGGQDE